MKVAVIHPLKHHAYYSLAGIMESDNSAVGLFGYYNKGDLLDYVLSKTSYSSLIDGYRYEKIDGNVKSNFIIKLLFLLSKKWPKNFESVYYCLYQKWCISQLKDVDCIHVLQDYCNDVIRFAKNHGIKVIYEQIIAFDMEQFISDKSDIEGNDKLRKQKENLLNSDYILMASDFVKKSITNHLGQYNLEKKMAVIPYGAETDQFYFRLRKYEKGKALRLLTVAAINKRKGIEFLLNAMTALQGKPVHLNLIGVPDADGQKLLPIISEMENVTYLGTVPHSQISQYYDNNDVFVLPSLAEGSSLSVYEAIASGMPCIVTPNVGSVIVDGLDGYIIPPKDSKSIEEKIELFLDHPDIIERMSDHTQVTIKQYDWKSYERKLGKFYDQYI